MREAAGYRQGRNCVSRAYMQIHVSIMQTERGNREREKGGERRVVGKMLCILEMARGLVKV